MPQTREHFEICRLLGLERGVIVLTKSDLVDARHAGARRRSKCASSLAGSFLADAPIVRGVGAHGRRARRASRRRSRRSRAGARAARTHGVVRLPIDRVFTVKGFGTVVTGTLVSGRVRARRRAVVLPDGRRVRVRGCRCTARVDAGGSAPRRRRGQSRRGRRARRCARGVDARDAAARSRRRAASTRGSSCCATPRPLRHGARVRVHHGTADVDRARGDLRGRETMRASGAQARVGETGVAGRGRIARATFACVSAGRWRSRAAIASSFAARRRRARSAAASFSIRAALGRPAAARHARAIRDG